jgi:small ligand-binding sensory domain FIST|tara:strand:- start:275 stop:1459 length:1185 start_codon:yes stop_codon:yes gene_type:complete
MKWASHLSTQNNIEACVDESVEAILSQMDGKSVDLTIIFVSPQFKDKYEEIPKLIRDRISSKHFLGCSGGGIIGGGKEAEQQAAFSMTCANLPDVEIQGIHTDTMKLPDQDTAPSVWREWLGVDVEKNPSFIFLADPFSFQGEEFLAGVDFAYPNSSKVGGLASGAQAQGGNALYLNDKIHNNGLIGLALSGNIGMDTIVAQGCRPIGEPVKVSKCDGTLLTGMDGQPPLELLQSVYEGLDENDKSLVQTSLFLGIEMDPLKDNPQQGDFLIRNIMGVEREIGGIHVGTLLREGQLVQFHLRDKAMSAEDLKLMLTRYKANKNFKNTSGALLFSCLGRGQYLYGKPNHDADMFRDHIGDIPLGGFFCNGEIGPVGKTTFLHGYTSSFGIFHPTH